MTAPLEMVVLTTSRINLMICFMDIYKYWQIMWNSLQKKKKLSKLIGFEAQEGAE